MSFRPNPTRQKLNPSQNKLVRKWLLRSVFGNYRKFHRVHVDSNVVVSVGAGLFVVDTKAMHKLVYYVLVITVSLTVSGKLLLKRKKIKRTHGCGSFAARIDGQYLTALLLESNEGKTSVNGIYFCIITLAASPILTHNT